MTAAGGSLEDCHTNVYDLADLNGLKWKCLVTSTHYQPKNVIDEDPVIRAYCECLTQNLICTWRRKPCYGAEAAFNDPTPRLDSLKELWIFYYSVEEPKCLETFDGLIVSNEYSAEEKKYQIRTVLFKALHNFIEQKFLQIGIIRFGKWFTKPLEEPVVVECERSLPEFITGINWHFFIHAENHICMTLNIQRQPTLFRLSRHHLDNLKRQPVILAPFSMRATLLPNQTLVALSKAEAGVNESSKTNSDDEINTVLNQHWNDWKKIYKNLPLDTLDDANQSTSTSNSCKLDSGKRTSGSSKEPIRDSQRYALPKMVLVEILGSQMYYPTCLVGILAEEMIRQSNSKSGQKNYQNEHNKENASKNAGTFGNIINGAFASEGGFSAEDNEVEEILNSSFNGLSNITPTKKNDYGKKIIPSSHRSCKKSFMGVRAGRRSYEDACLNANTVRRIDNSFMDSMNCSTFGNTPVPANLEEDTRWNFFDYLRRDYCYCKLCSNSSSNNNNEENTCQGLGELKGPYAFHRSPIALEAVTPDHSPTFVDELNSLKLATQERDKEGLDIPTWARSVSRRDVISGKLEVDSNFNNEADIFKVLPINKNFSSISTNNKDILPRVFTPFTPITSVTPEPIGIEDSNFGSIFGKDELSLQQRLKDFDYPYNPLKRDSIPIKEYHLPESTNSKPLGPPTDGFNINKTKLPQKSYLAGNENGCSTVATTSATAILSNTLDNSKTSILKTLLASNVDDSISMPPEENSSGYFNSAGVIQMVMQSGNSNVGIAKARRRRIRRKTKARNKIFIANTLSKKKLNWPKIDDLDSMASILDINEETETFVMEPTITSVTQNKFNGFYKMHLPISKYSESDFLNKQHSNFNGLSIENYSLNPATTSNVISNNNLSEQLDTMDLAGSASDPMTAITPPALLNADENPTNARLSDYSNLIERNPLQIHANESSKIFSQPQSSMSELSAFSMHSNSIINSVTSQDHMHILSPPASNERVDFPNNQIIMSLGAPGSTSSTSGPGIPSSIQQLFHTPGVSLNHDSFNIIYPTPPTPLQQFSPQNMSMNTQLIADSQYLQQPCSSNLNSVHEIVDLNGNSSIIGEQFGKLKVNIGEIFLSCDKVDFPESESFSKNLFDETEDLDEKLRLCSTKTTANTALMKPFNGSTNYNSLLGADQREALSKALQNRQKRVKLDMPPSYRLLAEKIRSAGNHERNSATNNSILATSLEKMEKELQLKVAGQLQNNFGNVMSMNYEQSFFPPGQGSNSIPFGYGMPALQHSNPNAGFPGMMSNMPGNSQTNLMTRAQMPPHFPPRMASGMMMNQQFLQQQQQMVNPMLSAVGQYSKNQMAEIPSQKMPSNYQNNVQQMQLFQQQQNFAKQNSIYGGIMPPPSTSQQYEQNTSANSSIFGKFNQQSGALTSQSPATSNVPPIRSSTGQFNSYQTQQQSTMNIFGNSSFMNEQQQQQIRPNSNSSVDSPASMFNPSTSTLNPTTGLEAGNNSQYQPPFGSPLAAKASGGPSPASAACLLNQQQRNVANSMGMDYQLSSVSSTSSSIGASVIGAVQTGTVSNAFSNSSSLINSINFQNMVNSLQNSRSFIMALLIQDTLIDLHFDSLFDSCPICCCNVNIRAYELGLYINASEDVAKCDRIQQKHDQDPRFMPDYWSGLRSSSQDCNCGFSAVRYRYLSAGFTGLFPDDIIEGTGQKPNYRDSSANRLYRFNPTKESDVQFVDLLRHLSLTKDMSAIVEDSYYLGKYTDNFDKPQKYGFDVRNPTDYIISPVDAEELDKIMNNIVNFSLLPTVTKELFPPLKIEQKLLHPWGFQISNSIREPKDLEFIAVIRELQPFLEDTIRKVRGHLPSYNKKFDSPLTWKNFFRKTIKTSQQENENSHPEPIPNIIVATEREPVSISPLLTNMWEKLSLAPYDQTKDVLYLAVVPDSTVIVEKSRIFLEELNSLYDKCRFGSHVRINIKETPRDGIIRIDHRNFNVFNPTNHSDNSFLSEHYSEDRKVFLSRLKSYSEKFESELVQFFKTNDAVFDRRAFHESVYRSTLQQNFTSLATSSDSTSMPPPAVPIQSPSSVLSSASGGPSSANATIPIVQLSPSTTAQQASPFNLSQPTLEELTLEGDTSSHSLPQPQMISQAPLTQQQTQLEEAAAEKFDNTIEEMHALENPGYLPHVIVIYLVNPFSFGSEAHCPLFAKMAMNALMRAYNSFLYQMDIRRRPQIQLEIINLQTIYDYTAFAADPLHETHQSVETVETNSNRDRMSAQDCLRRIAFSVYSQSRLLLPEYTRGILTKSMTRFGPASAFGDILDELNQISSKQTFNNHQIRLYKMPSNPYILAPTRIIGVHTNGTGSMSSTSKLQLISTEEKILFVNYCLLNDEWLCAAVTDEQGHLLDNVLINMSVPIENKNSNMLYKNQSQIYDTIQRLWLFIQSVLVMETRNWRLVIGRLGKIGHGEFRTWNDLLSKRSLKTYNNNLKKKFLENEQSGCSTCSLMPGFQEIPVIVSACLISTEPELYLRIFPTSPLCEGISGSATSTNSFSQNPISSSKGNRASKSSPLTSTLPPDDASITHILVVPTSVDISPDQQMNGANMQDDDADFDALLLEMPANENDHEEMMGIMDLETTKIEEEANFTMQPMAIGYYISTAPALDLPDWFWNACPSAKQRSPVHLKSSLHIHMSNILQNDDFISAETSHPLDGRTDEALRFILESYNALSWLNIDFATGRRYSCLPVHIQALLRLYKSVTTLFL